LWVLFAAALDDRISDVTLERGLLSYRSLTRSDRYLHGAGIFVPDILQHTDLPQVAGNLAGRRLTIAQPVDHMKRKVAVAEAKREYAPAEEAFAKRGGQLRILDRTEGLYEAS